MTKSKNPKPVEAIEPTELDEILEELVSCACNNCVVGVSIYATQHTAPAINKTYISRKEAVAIVEDEYQKSRTVGRIDDDGHTKLFVEVTLRRRIKDRLLAILEAKGEK